MCSYFKGLQKVQETLEALLRSVSHLMSVFALFFFISQLFLI